jgi:hypothetical protein
LSFDNASIVNYDFSDPLADWYIENPDEDFTWLKRDVGSDATLFLEIFRNNIKGKTDALISKQFPGYPFSANFAASPDTLYLELAYRNKLALVFRDSLFISSSADCGQTWYELYRNELNHLQGKAGDTNGYFIPTPVDWKTLSLPAYLAQRLVRIAVKSEFGNNVYLKSLRGIPNLWAIYPEAAPRHEVLIYPNPAEAAIYFENTLQMPVLYDLEGREIELKIAALRNAVWKADVSALKSGLYVVRCGEKHFKISVYH